jgi:hypothetical protein
MAVNEEFGGMCNLCLFYLENLKIIIHKTTILPVVFYDCENWPLTLREEHRNMFEDKMLIRILVLRKRKLTKGWRKLHDKQHNSYASPNMRAV